MRIEVPDLCLVVLMGASGSGKSTFAARHFRPTEVLSSDACRAMVSDDPNDQSASADAFDVLYHIAAKRLARGRLTVVDATSVRREDRAELVRLARDHDVLPVPIVLDLDPTLAAERNEARPDRDFPARVVHNHSRMLRRSLRHLKREGFRGVSVLRTPDEVDAAEVVRTPLWNDRRELTGPFDIVGDVHGCYAELCDLLETLGYDVDAAGHDARHPDGRTLVFVGDLVDRGPATPDVLKLAMTLCRDGRALAVPGNHDVKLQRALDGRKVKLTHGLDASMQQLAGESDEFRREVGEFIDGLVSHLRLDGGRLVVTHAGIKAGYIGRASGRVREFCLYGDTTGETDADGLPVRLDWAAEYDGEPAVVYGHTPVPAAEWRGRTICLDTGCCFGGTLSALRWPEREVVSVPARETYVEPPRPIAPPDAASPFLDVADALGKRSIPTRLGPRVTVRAENAAAAFEVATRFGTDPRWLIYLPATMSPADTPRDESDLLERPAEAFDYFRGVGVGRVICQEKHMGSRAIVVVCRDRPTAAERFGPDADGAIYTRTGRPFFSDAGREAEVLRRVRDAAEAAGLFDELNTGWLALDCELMPWSAKAVDLLRSQYAPTGAAAEATLAAAADVLARTAQRQPEVGELLEQTRERLDQAGKYRAAYRRYCWDVAETGDLRLAPFHLLAAEGRVFDDADHAWHMATLARLAEHDAMLVATTCREVDLHDDAAVGSATAWWDELTAAGGEGMVVKPLDPAGWTLRGTGGIVQPALKVRGREYLRIIYGPHYTSQLNALRQRSTKHKRSMAVREHVLGLEALHRFVERAPLRTVHECVLGVLALESEPVDPRL